MDLDKQLIEHNRLKRDLEAFKLRWEPLLLRIEEMINAPEPNDAPPQSEPNGPTKRKR